MPRGDIAAPEWTEEENARLERLWGEGHSTAEIGRLMLRTKSSIVGRAHRLGLPGRESPIKVGPRAPSVARRGSPRKAPKTTIAPIPAGKPEQPWRVPAPSPPPPPPVKFVFGARSCQWPEWPFNSTRAQRGKFCGKASVPGRVYCAHHCSIAYTRAKDQA